MKWFGGAVRRDGKVLNQNKLCLMSLVLWALLIGLSSNLAFSEESIKDHFVQPSPLSAENEKKIIEATFEKLKHLMLNAKNVEVFANPERIPAAEQTNRCQMVADKLVKGQVNSISTLPYESSTQFADLAKNSSGELRFLEEAYSKYGGCSANAFSDKIEGDFRTSFDDPVDKENPHSYRLIKQKNILLLVEVSHRSHDEKINNIIALYTYPDDDGFLTGYVNGKKIERPDCADNFISLYTWRKPTSFVVAFPMDDILIAAYFKEPAITEDKKNANNSKRSKLLNWVPNQPSKSLLALHFLDNPKNYIEKYRGGLINTLNDSDCIIAFQPNTPTDGDNQ